MTITIDSSGNVSPGLTIPVLNATTFNISGQITSTVVTGTAPLVVASTTAVANLNASYLLGGTWAAPGAIGTTTPSTGAFTQVSSTTGLLGAGVYAGAYTDGIVADYTAGVGRISVGASDQIKFYNGGIANTLLATLDATGLNIVGGTHASVTAEVTAATYTQTVNDSDIFVNFAGTVTLTLLNPATYPGRYLSIRTYQAQLVNSASANVSVNGVVGSAILPATAGKWVTMKSDGTNWEVLANN